MSKETEPTGDEAQDLRLLFEHATNEMRFLKSQQWTITNYVVAVYVAVIAITSLLESNFSCGVLPCEHYFLAIAAVFAAIFGLRMIRRIDKDLTKNRERIDKAVDGLSEAFKAVWVRIPIAEKEKISRNFSAVLQAVILVGGLVVVYLIIVG